MTEITVPVPKPHIDQINAYAAWKDKRFLLMPCGRGWGKTVFSERVLVKDAVSGHDCHYGTSQHEKNLELYLRLERRLAPLIKDRHKGVYLYLSTGGSITFWTLSNPDAGQGRHPNGTWIIDEAGLIPDLERIWQSSIRPSLSRHKARAIITGRPSGQNYYYHLWNSALDMPDIWGRHTASSYNNPYIDRTEIDQARREMPEHRFRQEYLAEFLDDGAGVFKYVNRARYGSMPTLADLDRRRDVVIGVDLGKLNDYTVFMVIDRQNKQVVYYERMQGDYVIQLDKLVSLCQRLNVTGLVVETNTGQMFIEEAIRRGLRVTPFTTTNASKQRAIENLAVAFERGDITIPDDDILINELMSFEAERLASGMMRYSAPAGYHDDTVMALALAWDAIASTVVWDLTREGFGI